MSAEKFAKYFGKYAPVVNAGDIQLIFTGEFKPKKIRQTGRFYDVPVYEIVNPENIPYTKVSLDGYMHDEINRFRSFIEPGINAFAMYEIEGDDFYIPEEVERNIRKCLSTKILDKPIKIKNEEYRILGTYDNDFTLETEEENIKCSVGFKLNRVTKVDKNYGGTILSKSEAEDVFHFVNQQDMEFFEDKIWICFTDNLMNGGSFVDFNWMGWYTNFHLV